MIRILKTTEVAALLDCTVETINGLASSGYLPALKVGRSWVFMPEPLEASLSERSIAESKDRRKVASPVVYMNKKLSSPPQLPELIDGDFHSKNRKFK